MHVITNNIKLYEFDWLSRLRLINHSINHSFSCYLGNMSTKSRKDFKKQCEFLALHCNGSIYRDTFWFLFLTSGNKSNEIKTLCFVRIVLISSYEVILLHSVWKQKLSWWLTTCDKEKCWISLSLRTHEINSFFDLSLPLIDITSSLHHFVKQNSWAHFELLIRTCL